MNTNAEDFFGKSKGRKYENLNQDYEKSTLEFQFYKDSFIENPWESLEKRELNKLKK